jgi:hypothetical protein
VFAAWIPAADADQYIAGCIILAAAPCVQPHASLVSRTSAGLLREGWADESPRAGFVSTA